MLRLFILGLGGAIGTVLRYFTAGVVQRYSDGAFPLGTLGVNLIGSLCIGLVWGLFEGIAVSAHVRTFLLIGVLGAFTTFSTFTLENFHFMRDGEIKVALINVLVSNAAGIALVFGGYFMSRYFIGIFKQ
jgi:CrcB protein